MMDTLTDRTLKHLESVEALLLKMFDTDFGNVLWDTLLDQVLFSYSFQLIWFDLHQLARLLAVSG